MFDAKFRTWNFQTHHKKSLLESEYDAWQDDGLDIVPIVIIYTFSVYTDIWWQ